MEVIVQFSGGKDSLASLLWAIAKYGANNVTAVFCDTKWEHEITYKHINEVVEKLGIKLIVLTSRKYNGMVDLAVKKKRFPSTKARFCTEELKTKPMIDYILDNCKTHLLIIQGIRADESESRSLMNKQCSYFKYYFEPYQTNSMIVEALESKEVLSVSQKIKLRKAKARLAKGKEDKKFHTYRKKEIFKWREKYADDILRPIFDWTGQQTIDYILQNGMKPNPLYYLGFSRVGCLPCIMCKKQEVKSMIDYLPDAVVRLEEAEKEVGRSFFPPDYVPKRYCSKTDKGGKKYPTVQDVLKYIGDTNATGDLFKEDNKPHKCMSFYGICE